MEFQRVIKKPAAYFDISDLVRKFGILNVDKYSVCAGLLQTESLKDK